MPPCIKTVREQSPAGRFRALWCALVLFLSGCSDVPESLNPIALYRGVAGSLRGNEIAPEPTRPVPGANQPFPSLGTVPAAPTIPALEQRRQMEMNLAADRQGAVFTAEGTNVPAATVAALPATDPPPLAPLQGPGANLAAPPQGNAGLRRESIAQGRLATIGFPAGGSKVLEIQQLRDAVSAQKSTGAVLRVVGHASRDGGSLGSRQVANFRTSMERAEAVARALLDLGVPASRIMVDARGDNDLADPVNPTSGVNRRVEIYLEY